MMGSRDKVFAEAERAFFAGDAQWAAKLTPPLIRIDRNDWAARHLNAAARDQQTSSSLRGFYLTGALEIEGKVDPGALERQIAVQLFSPANEPSEALFNMLGYRVNPERASGSAVRLGYRFTDTKEDSTLTLRNGVLQVEVRRADNVDARVDMTRNQFNQLFTAAPYP